MPEPARQKVFLFSDSEVTLLPLCCALAREQDWEIIVAAPAPQKLAACVTQIQKQFPTQTIHLMKLLNKATDWANILKAEQPHYVLILTAVSDETLASIAKQCIDIKCHCLDTTDLPNRLACLQSLDATAKDHHVSVICGVNQVPGLSSVIIDTYASKFSTLREIYCGVSASRLSLHGFTTNVEMTQGLGEPFERLEGGVWKTVYGWQNLHRYYYGDNMGYRWHANRNIPDITLFPKRYPTLKSMVFHTGVENPYIHWILWHLSWLRRIRILPKIGWISRFLGWSEKACRRKKMHRQGMVIQMLGVNEEYQPLDIKWSLVAEETEHDEILSIICQLILRNLRQEHITPGVQACLGLFTLSQFDEKLSSRVYHTVEETSM